MKNFAMTNETCVNLSCRIYHNIATNIMERFSGCDAVSSE